MRDLSTREKKLVKEIIKECVPGSETTIGMVLMPIYKIACIAKHMQDYNELRYLSESEYSSVYFQYYNNNKRNFESEIYEAILLLLLLEKEGYIFFNFSSFNNVETIGEFCKSSTILDAANIDTKIIYDVFPDHKLWYLLNSNCIVTNSLKDYAKDFKTEEQRNFKKSVYLTWIAISIALISCVNDFFPSFYKFILKFL